MDTEVPNKDQGSVIKPYQIPLILGIIGLIILLIGLRLIFFPIREPEIKFNSEASTTPQKVTNIKIDISGAVLKPGVYELISDARIQDLLVLAGGLSPDADREYVAQKINLAQKLVDGGKLYIPAVGEIQINSSNQIQGDISSNYNININTASTSELDILPGIGEVTAQKIIDARPYQSVEELLTKKIVGQSVYEKIKDKISAY